MLSTAPSTWVRNKNRRCWRLSDRGGTQAGADVESSLELNRKVFHSKSNDLLGYFTGVLGFHPSLEFHTSKSGFLFVF